MHTVTLSSTVISSMVKRNSCALRYTAPPVSDRGSMQLGEPKRGVLIRRSCACTLRSCPADAAHTHNNEKRRYISIQGEGEGEGEGEGVASDEVDANSLGAVTPGEIRGTLYTWASVLKKQSNTKQHAHASQLIVPTQHDAGSMIERAC